LFFWLLPSGYRLLKKVLDLAIHAPQLIGRPGFEVCPKRWIYPQQKGFSVGHDQSERL
jgi:hypothetical protein